MVARTRASDVYVYEGVGVDCCGTTKSVPDHGNVKVVLGGLFPVHQNSPENVCGEILDLGVQRLEAMVFAVDRVNVNTSLLPNITLAFEILDTCAQATYALDGSLRFVTGRTAALNETIVYGISGVVGAASSSVSIAVANLFRLFTIPQVSYASTTKVLSDKSRYDYFLRTVPPDLLQARAMADIVTHFNWTYVVAVHSDDSYGSDGISAFIDELTKRNATTACIATTISLPLVASQSDFDDAVQTLTEDWVSNATVVVLFGQLATATGLLDAVMKKQSNDPSFAEKALTWIGSDAWGDQLPSKYHEVVAGMLSVIPQSNLSKEFDDYFTCLKPENNSANPWFAEYWESFFNCTLSGLQGFTPCNSSQNRISSESGYRQNSKVPFVIDAVDAFAHALHNLIAKNCVFDQLLNCSEVVDISSGATSIKGDLLLQSLHDVSFPGESAPLIEFDSNGDQLGGYSIKNLKKAEGMQGTYLFETVGVWDGLVKLNDALRFCSDIEWNENYLESVPQSICSEPCRGGEYSVAIPDQATCCWTCRICEGNRQVSSGTQCFECEQGYKPNSDKTACEKISPTYLKWTHPWSIIIILLTCLGAVATSLVIVIFVLYHDHSIVKASSRELSAVLLIGLLLCYILPFFFFAKPSAPICAIRRFGVGFCFALCYSALLVKTNRIHRLFNRSQITIQKPPLVSPQSQLLFTSLLVLVQVIIAVVWLVVEVPGITYVYHDFSTDLRCSESPYFGLPVSLGYNCVLLVLSTYFAFRSRKIPQNFNEARFINLTLYTLCIIWLAFIPTYFATATLGTVYQTSSQVIAIAMSATTTLCCLFVPKVYFLLSGIRKDQNSNSYSQSTHQRPSISEGHHVLGTFGGSKTSFSRPSLLSLGKSVSSVFSLQHLCSPNTGR